MALEKSEIDAPELCGKFVDLQRHFRSTLPYLGGNLSLCEARTRPGFLKFQLQYLGLGTLVNDGQPQPERYLVE